MRYLARLTEHRQVIRVALLDVGTAAAVGVTYAALSPAPARRGVEYKYMHCRECGFERQFDAQMAEGRCPLCKPPKVGYFESTMERTGNRQSGSPWWQPFPFLWGSDPGPAAPERLRGFRCGPSLTLGRCRTEGSWAWI
jgi:hypothetical protein